VLPRWLVNALAILIALAWAVNLTVGLVYPGRSDPYLNGIFALVVGAVFTIGRLGDASRAARRRAAKLLDPPPDDDPRGDQS